MLTTLSRKLPHVILHVNFVGRRSKLTLAAAAVSAVLVAAQFASPVFAARTPPASAQITAPVDVRAGFADLIEAVQPAVVTISVKAGRGGPRIGSEQGPEFQFPPGSPFNEFFERYFSQPQPRHFGGHETQAVGSGFIIDAGGYVVTNHHVIDGATEITVVLNDGSQHTATLEGHDEKTDLALLKIESDDEFPYVVFGDSDKTRAGDWVVAIGNPFGLGGSATAGTVSARGRDIQAGPFDDFLQVDAPINRGNSGGPLFDTSGKVIGVNTAIFSPNGGNVGIGFAIPATLAKSVIDDLRDNGTVERGWLGVQIQAVTKDIAKSLGLEEARGALVADVVADSPAHSAGLRRGDVILGFAGKDVKRLKDLTRIVADTDADTTATLEVWRNGKTSTLEARISAAPQEQPLAARGIEDSAEPQGKLGLALAPLTAETLAQFDLDETATGAVIVGVRPDGPAARKGLRVGDVVTMVGQTKVNSPEDVVAAVKATGDQGAVLLLITRSDGERFVAIDLA